MPKTSPLDSINQNLDALSLDELLEVRAKVDALIEKKVSSPRSGYKSVVLSGSYRRETYLWRSTLPSKHWTTIPAIEEKDTIVVELKSFSPKEGLAFTQFPKLQTDKDDSLETVINLVDEWILDESGYDEEAYPQIEEGLKQNRTSL